MGKKDVEMLKYVTVGLFCPVRLLYVECVHERVVVVRAALFAF